MPFDKDGLLVTQQYDAGDSCAEEGRYWFLYWFNFVYMSNYGIVKDLPDRGHPDQYIPLLESSPGVYVRSPDPNLQINPAAFWESDPNTTSRDQLIPIIWYCAAFKDYARLGRLFWACLKRFIFAQDIYANWYTPPPTWKVPDQMWTCLGYFIRAGGWWTAIFYPLLFFFDTLDFIGVLFALFPYTVPESGVVWYNPSTWLEAVGPTNVDDNNMDVCLLGAIPFKPTPISWLNRIVWGQFRATNDGNALGYTNNCLAAMAWYHAPQNGGNQFVVTLYSAPILKYLKKIL